MRILLFSPLMLLSACMTDRQIMDRTCSHQIAIRDAANAALALAESKPDSVAKAIAIDQAHATLDRLKSCPPISG